MRVLVVEDDVELAHGMVSHLQAQGVTVEAVDDGEVARRRLAAGGIDMALIDVGLPGLSGYELVRGIRADKLPVAVILVTARDALSDRIYGLDLGADDYLAKPFELGELSARMRAVARRIGHLARSERVFGPLKMDAEDHMATLAGEPMTLTGREWAVLAALVESGGRTVPKERLVADGSANAVEVYISRLRPRLEVAGLVIRSVRGFGYRLEHRGNAPDPGDGGSTNA
ncbi:MAG TPA: response regulator transcription factor [Denitromonas sp.]|uniref:response regulator transcription factor n=1 Tax=Denitromonas sp. TaxID=2734609 RepID=UPI001D44DD54|nr:response regulator transcription factor [Rhodocyclaceae bacterium]MCP5220136.1 response regulator transcription factor [Zoogloeaceae bacterium]HQU88885.1 response regulator transcription factor [Denitromonas sp.]HQV14714.1 response regulator transcription factor [Denitromonas sp.]